MNKRQRKWLGTKWRFLIFGITIILTILTMALGSSLYIAKKGTKSFEYAGGAEILVKINSSTDQAIDQKLKTQVIEGISQRINPNNLSSIKLTVESNDKIRVTVSGTSDQASLASVENIITNKPTLSLYTIDDKAIFINGTYNDQNRDLKKGESDAAPLKSGGAKVVQSRQGKIEVEMALKNDYAEQEWQKATRAISQLKKGQNKMVIWLNHGINENRDSSIDYLLNQYQNSLRAFANEQGYYGNLYNFLFVHNDPKSNVFKSSLPLEATRYMLSNASVNKVLTGSTFVIEGHFSRAAGEKLANDINYGASNYTLTKVLSHFIDANYGNGAFEKAVIAGLIVLSLVAIIMIVNYGLLGALSTISIALYMFLTLMLFTILRGEYSPSTIAALIIGIGMSVDANIITFERLKAEVYKGNSIRKANGLANKLSLSTIFDANITTMIVGFVLFYFGSSSVRGFSIMLIISIIFTLVVMLVFTRLLSTLIIRTGVFEKRVYLLGAHRKYLNQTKTKTGFTAKVANLDFIKQSKWFGLGSTLMIGVSVIVFAIIAAVGGALSSGVNSSIDFAGGTVIDIQGTGKYQAISEAQAKQIKTYLVTEKEIGTDQVAIIYQGQKDQKDNYILKVSTKKILDIQAGDADEKDKENSIQTWVKNHVKNHDTQTGLKVDVIGDQVTNEIATALVRNAMIAISLAMLAIVIYTLIRFRWTYSFAAIIALIHDGLIVTAVFIITRVQISPIFIAALLSVTGYSINDTIVTFDRVREQKNAIIGKVDQAGLKKIANGAVRDTLKRSLLTSATTITAVLVLIMFGNATKFSFNFAMLIGLISGTYSSIFIATYIWYRLELIVLKRRTKRAGKVVWKVTGIEEQTIQGINELKSN